MVVVNQIPGYRPFLEFACVENFYMGVSTFLCEAMGSIKNYNFIKQWFRNYVSIKTAVSIGNVTTALQVLID